MFWVDIKTATWGEHLISVGCCQRARQCTAGPWSRYMSTYSLLLWIDGTSTGQRSVTVTKLRLLDRDRTFFPSGVSKVMRWMERFLGETKIPLEYRQLLVSELNTVFGQQFEAGSRTVSLEYPVPTGDHKQLNSMCGVQGGLPCNDVPFVPLRRHYSIWTLLGDPSDEWMRPLLTPLNVPPRYSFPGWPCH